MSAKPGNPIPYINRESTCCPRGPRRWATGWLYAFLGAFFALAAGLLTVAPQTAAGQETPTITVNATAEAEQAAESATETAAAAPAAPVTPPPAPTATAEGQINDLVNTLAPDGSGAITLSEITANRVLGVDGAKSEREEMLRLLDETSKYTLGDTHQIGVVQPLTLEEALRETLKQQPEVKLAEQDVATAAAQKRIATGEFDLTFQANASVEETNTEKTPSQIQEAVQERAERQQEIQQVRQERRDLQAAIRSVNRGEAPEASTLNKLSVFDSLEDQLQNALLEDALTASDAADVLDGLDAERRGAIVDGFEEDIRELNRQEADLLKASSENGLTTVNTSRATKYKLMLLKKFRNGVRTEFGLDFDRQGAKAGSPTDNKGKVIFNLIIPLGKGSGQVANWANERAAIKEVEAAEATLRHRVAERSLETILSYWDLVAAQQELNILNASEALNRTLIHATDERITAGRATDTELQLALARYQEILAQRTQVEARIISARQLLALNIGRSQDTIKPITDFPFATSRFAAPLQMADLALLDPKEESSRAVTRRFDVLAALKREDSSSIRRDAAWRDRLPKADFRMDSFYGTVTDGAQYEELVKLWGTNYVGPSATFALDFEYQFGNNRAMGNYAQSVSELERAKITSMDLRRQIIAGVLFDIAELTTTLAEIKRFDLAYGSYSRAHEYEVELFQNGAERTNLINVVQSEERLTNASRSLLDSIRRHVQAIARYNFDTGQLLTPGPGAIDLNYDNVKALPYDPVRQAKLDAAAAAGTPVVVPTPAPGTPSPAAP
jgi:outer membrane protein TolC